MVAIVAQPHLSPSAGLARARSRAERSSTWGEPRLPRAPGRRSPAHPDRDRRQTDRCASALRAWVMSLEGASRGFAVSLSEHGALLRGVCSPLAPQERALCKIELSTGREPLVVRVEVVRNDGRDLAVRFVDLNLDEWFRLARFVDGAV